MHFRWRHDCPGGCYACARGHRVNSKYELASDARYVTHRMCARNLLLWHVLLLLLCIGLLLVTTNVRLIGITCSMHGALHREMTSCYF
jgi:hypothetical protein